MLLAPGPTSTLGQSHCDWPLRYKFNLSPFFHDNAAGSNSKQIDTENGTSRLRAVVAAQGQQVS